MSIPADALLAHEGFVRSVVRGLVSDESARDDVVQETWLTALTHRPEAVVSVRGWLARVAERHARARWRGETRRRRREQTAAREEEVAAEVASARERLELRREVVAAVLALDEPYRTVVLLSYERGLAPAAIAELTGTSAATVRSQLHRARRRLRERLDQHDPERRWMLLAAAPRAVSAAGPAVLVALAGALGSIAAVALTWTALSRNPSVSDLEAGAAGRSAGLLPLATGETTETDPEAALFVEPARRAAAREPVVSQDADEGGEPTLGELRRQAVHVQREITRRALAPDPRHAREQAALLELPDTGIVKLLDRQRSSIRSEVLKRGGGSYYSFATLDHSYDREPDVGLERASLRSGFYGVRFGAILRLGEVPLAALSGDSGSGPPPVPLSEEGREVWEILWSEIDEGGQTRQDLVERSWRDPLAEQEITYLVRTSDPDEHDHLVAFRVLELDEESCTLAWRILKRWPVERRSTGPRVTGEYGDVPAASAVRAAELAALDLPGLRAALTRLRERAAPVLWEVDPELEAEYAQAVGSRASLAQRSGVSRILRRGEWDPLVTQREGGAYLDFSTGSHEYSGGSDVELQGGYYSSGFAGSQDGWLLDLGALEFEELRAVLAGKLPERCAQRTRDAWNLVFELRTERDEHGRPSLSEETRARARSLGLVDRVPAHEGHTYLLRTVLYDDSDEIIVFTTIASDESGHTLAWKILQSFPTR